MARPYLNRCKLAKLQPGDTLRIGVCIKGPAIIKIPLIDLTDDSKCELISEAASPPKDISP